MLQPVQSATRLVLIATMSVTDINASSYVTLVSADGFEFHIRRSAAVRSGTIRRMLDGTYTSPSAH
jgi:hypothetical protein